MVKYYSKRKNFIDFCHVFLCAEKKNFKKHWPSKFQTQKSANITITDKMWFICRIILHTYYIFEVGRRVNICKFAAQIFYSFKSTKNFNSEKKLWKCKKRSFVNQTSVRSIWYIDEDYAWCPMNNVTGCLYISHIEQALIISNSMTLTTNFWNKLNQKEAKKFYHDEFCLPLHYLISTSDRIWNATLI